MAKKKPKKMATMKLADLTSEMVEEAVTTPENDDEWCAWGEPPEFICGLDCEVVHEEGGGEGGGSHVEVVLKITEGNEARYFRKTGYYASFKGTDWDSDPPTEVFPKQATVTQYEPKG